MPRITRHIVVQCLESMFRTGIKRFLVQSAFFRTDRIFVWINHVGSVLWPGTINRKYGEDLSTNSGDFTDKSSVCIVLLCSRIADCPAKSKLPIAFP